MKKLTPRQAEALRFIRDFIRLHGSSPSEAELARHLGMTPASAHDLVVRLQRGGWIQSLPRVARSMVPVADHPDLEREAKGMVLLAFRNGPIEDIHAGTPCPHCRGKPGSSRITDDEMKMIMKTAVNRVFSLFVLKDERPDLYEQLLRFADLQTSGWDSPVMTTDF